MLNSPMQFFDRFIAEKNLDRQQVQDGLEDLDERQAILDADRKAERDFQIFRSELNKPFESEKPVTAYQIFQALKNAYIDEYSRRLREGCKKDSIRAAWLLMVYVSDEQADAFMMGKEETRTKLLKAIIENDGMWAGKTWVNLI